MDSFIIFWVSFAIAIVVVPITVVTLLYRWIRKLLRRGSRRQATMVIVFSLAAFLLTCYGVCRFFNPGDSWYKERFQADLGINFPADGIITHKVNEYYVIAYALELSPKSYKELLERLPQNHEEIDAPEADKVIANYGKPAVIATHRHPDKIYASQNTYLLFLDDDRTVIYVSGELP